jgi:hypothetical protein
MWDQFCTLTPLPLSKLKKIQKISKFKLKKKNQYFHKISKLKNFIKDLKIFIIFQNFNEYTNKGNNKITEL